MAQCPSCSQNIAITEDNFGTLYRCEHCRAEFFIGFDGVPENSKQANPEPTSSGNKDLKAENAASVVNVTSPMNMTIDMGILEPPGNSDSAGLYNIPDSPQDQPVGNFFQVQEPLQVPSPEPLVAPLTSIAPEPVKQIPNPGMAFKNFTKDVQEFGNEVSSAGVLSFDIEITGIDLAETRNKLLDALDDKRFGWNLEEIGENIKDGTLKLEKITAPKIIVLVKRINSLGLNLNWRHNVSTQ